MLTLEHVSKSFSGAAALSDVSFTVNEGETFCLLGANGAGKTTSINLLLGFLRPDAGQVRVGGADPYEEPKKARAQIAYIPERVALYPNLTGLENLMLFDRLSGRRASRSALADTLEAVGLPAEAFNRRTAHYSKGMCQKVGLAVALSREARALLLDEPLSGLDPKAANDVQSDLARLRSQGRAILMATHDLFRAKEIATRIGIMRAGTLVETLDPASIDASALERIYLDHMNAETAA